VCGVRRVGLRSDPGQEVSTGADEGELLEVIAEATRRLAIVEDPRIRRELFIQRREARYGLAVLLLLNARARAPT